MEQQQDNATHASARWKRIKWSVVASVSSRPVVFVSRLAFVPLAIRYFGEDHYGLWLTVSAVALTLSISGFGLGYGMINSLSEANGNDDRKAARRHVSTGVALYLAIALAGVVALFAVVRLIPCLDPTRADPADAASVRTLRGLILIVGAFFFMRFPLSIVEVTYQGYQEGYFAQIWMSARNACELIWLLLAMGLGLSLLGFASVHGVGALLVMGAAWCFLFLRHKPWLSVRISLVNRESLRRILSTSFYFLLIQLGMMLTTCSSNVIIAASLGGAEVPRYAVTFTLLQQLMVLCSMLTGPLWPAYGEAATRGDWNWVRRTRHP